MNSSAPAQRQQSLQVKFFMAVMLASFVFMAMFPRVFFPIISAYVLMLILRPLHNFYRRLLVAHKVSVMVGVCLILSVTVWALVKLGTLLAQEISEFSLRLPQVEFFLRQKISSINLTIYQNFNIKMDLDLATMLIEQLKDTSQKILVDAPAVMGNALEWLLLTPIFAWFFMVQGAELKRRFLRLIPNVWFERTYILFHQFNGRFGGYIVAKTIEATILGLIIWIGLWCLDFPYAFLLGLIGGVTNIIPYVGPVLGWGGALLVGGMQHSGNVNLLGMTLVFLIANIIDIALVFPLLVSRIVNLHPLIVVASVIIGSQLGGLVGMILCVPVATFLKLVLEDLHRSFYLESQR